MPAKAHRFAELRIVDSAGPVGLLICTVHSCKNAPRISLNALYFLLVTDRATLIYRVEVLVGSQAVCVTANVSCPIPSVTSQLDHEPGPA